MHLAALGKAAAAPLFNVEDAMQTMAIGLAAREARVGVETIGFYERKDPVAVTLAEGATLDEATAKKAVDQVGHGVLFSKN